MPITAFGQYEVVVTTPVEGKDKVLATKTFNYLPLHRIILIVIILTGGIICLFRPWRHWRMTIQRWLVAIPAMPLVVMLVIPSPFVTAILGLIFVQLFGLCTLMLFAGKSQSCRATTATLLGYALNAVPSMVVTAIVGRSWGVPMVLGFGLLSCLTWYLPVMFSLIAIRRKYSILRLLAGLGVSWLIVILVIVGIIYPNIGNGNLIFLLPIALAIMMYTSLFPVGFLVLMTTNGWCREGIIRTFGLDRDRPTPPPLPQQERPIAPPGSETVTAIGTAWPGATTALSAGEVIPTSGRTLGEAGGV